MGYTTCILNRAMTFGYAQCIRFFANWENICSSGRSVLHIKLYTVRVLLQEDAIQETPDNNP
jgi:hypothetical protein